MRLRSIMVGVMGLLLLVGTTACGIDGGDGPAATATVAPTATLPPFTKVVQASVTKVGDGTGISATAICPSNSTLLSGGYRITGMDAPVASVQSSYPDTPSSWTVAMQAIGNGGLPDTVPFTLTVTANCLQTNLGITTATPFTVPVLPPDGNNHFATQTCPTGTVLTGGGYKDSVGIAMSKSNGNAWALSVLSQLGGTSKVAVYAVCATGAIHAGTQNLTTVNVSKDAPSSTSVTCPSGQILTGGGYDLTGIPVTNTENEATGDLSAWQATYGIAEILGPGPPSFPAKTYAVCALVS